LENKNQDFDRSQLIKFSAAKELQKLVSDAKQDKE